MNERHSVIERLQLMLHKAAKQAFDQLEGKKVPSRQAAREAHRKRGNGRGGGGMAAHGVQCETFAVCQQISDQTDTRDERGIRLRIQKTEENEVGSDTKGAGETAD